MSAQGWAVTPAWWRALAVSATGATLALVMRRPDLVVVTATLVLAVAMDWRRPPAAPPPVHTMVTPDIIREDEEAVLTHRVGPVPPGGTLTLVSGYASGTGARGSLTGSGQPPAPSAAPTRWGVHDLSPRSAQWTTTWGGWSGTAPVDQDVRLTVLPRRTTTGLRALPPPVGTGPGPDPGTRHGDGTDYTGLRPLLDGETPRRVHWPTTLRTGQVVVTQTLQDTTGSYLIVVDVHDAQVGDRHDAVVREVAGLSADLIKSGSDIALAVLGGGDVLPVPMGGGPRHLARAELTLVKATPRPGHVANDHQSAQVRRLRLPRATVVIAFTPLRDPTVPALLVRLHAAGHRVLVLDTAQDGDSLGSLERRVSHLHLESRGVPVTAWVQGAQSVNVALARLRGRRMR